MKDDHIRTVAMEVSALYGITKRKFADDVAKNIIEDYAQKYFLLALFLITGCLLYEQLTVVENSSGIISHMSMAIFMVYVVCRCIQLQRINYSIDVFHYAFVCRHGNEGKYLRQHMNDAAGVDLLKHCIRLTSIQNPYVMHVSVLLLGICVKCLWDLGFAFSLILCAGFCTGLVVVRLLSIRKAKWYLHFLQEKHKEFNLLHVAIQTEAC
ncbi:MAG: hypothetical protein ACOYN2_01470 [Patescibacteria group bacterium]